MKNFVSAIFLVFEFHLQKTNARKNSYSDKVITSLVDCRDVRGAVFTAVHRGAVAVNKMALRCGEQISLRCGAVKKDQ